MVCFQFQINKRKKIGLITKRKSNIEKINSGFVKKLEDTNGKEFTKKIKITTKKYKREVHQLENRKRNRK